MWCLGGKDAGGDGVAGPTVKAIRANLEELDYGG
jgi:hypothetical protein